MNKNKKYHCVLFVVAVIAFFSLASVNASDNFVKISLPKGVSIELPKNWMIKSKGQRIALDTMVESLLDLTGIEQENSAFPFAANYYKNGRTIGIINIRYYPNLDLTQNHAYHATLKDINELDATLRENVVKPLRTLGTPILSWEGTKKITFNGITAFVTEYRRKSTKDTGAFRVRLIRVFARDRSFTLTVSYNEKEAVSLKIITDRIISSLKLSGINETSVATSQVYTKSTSNNTDSVMSQVYSAWVIMLALSVLYTWGIGLTPPLIIRFLIVRRPIGKWGAIGTVVGFFFMNIILFTILNKVIADAVKDLYIYRSKSHGALILVAAVSYLILRKKPKQKADQKKEDWQT